MIDTNELMTTPELARLFGVSRQRIVAMCARGQIPHVRKGPAYFFSRRVIERQFVTKINAAAARLQAEAQQMSLEDYEQNREVGQ